MITPEGTDSEGRRPRAGRAVVLGIAALAVFFGLIALGSLTSPDPLPETTTTTSTTIEEVRAPIDPENFSVSQIATGDPLEWEQAMVLDDGIPLALLDHEDDIYLFMTEAPSGTTQVPGGLRAWRSADGVTWELLGEVIGQSHLITRVVSTGQGLMALEPEPGTGFTVWQSNNGADWTAEEIVVDDLNEFTSVYPITAAGTEEILVVSGVPQFDIGHLVRERLGDVYYEVGNPISNGWTVNPSDDDIELTVRGPLELTLATLTSDDLELSDEEVEQIHDSYTGNTPPQVWTRNNSGWRQAAIEEDQPFFTIAATPDGRVFASGFTESSGWVTTDGLSWEELSSPEARYLDTWGDRLVGIEGVAGVSLVAIDENGSSEEIGLEQHFPDTLNWNVGTLATGSGGLAAVVIVGNPLSPQPGVPEPASLTRDGATLTMDSRSNEYRLQVDGETHTWRPPSETSGIELDIETGMVSFHDPETDAVLAFFELADIGRAYNEAQSESFVRWDHGAIAFTDDGIDWTIQDLSVLGRETEVSFLEVTESRLVAIAMDEGSFNNPTGSTGLEIWSAEIP